MKQLPGMVWEVPRTKTIPVTQFEGCCDGLRGSKSLIITWLSPIVSWPDGKILQCFIRIDPDCELYVTLSLVLPTCCLSSCTTHQCRAKPTDVLRCLKLHLRPCFQLWSEGRGGSAHDFVTPQMQSTGTTFPFQISTVMTTLVITKNQAGTIREKLWQEVC